MSVGPAGGAPRPGPATGRPAGREHLRPSLRRLAVSRAYHPWLFATFPAVFLWSQNLGKASFRDALPPLLATLGGAAALVWVLRAAVSDKLRASLVASVVLLFVLSYGHLDASVGDWAVFATPDGDARLLGVWAIVLAACVAGIARLRHARIEANRMANGAAAVMLVVTAVPIASYEISTGSRRSSATPLFALAADAPVERRDVYYLVFDRYASDDTLKRVFAYDNIAFWTALEQRGFAVLHGSRGNYPKTAHSLASTLNMDYVQTLLAGESPAADDWGPLYRLLDDHAVGKTFSSLGYRYVHIGSWWEPTARIAAADVNLAYDPLSEFARTYWETTAAAAVAGQFGIAQEALDERRLEHSRALWQFETIPRSRDRRGPTFTFAHLTVPHPPYVFDRDGSYIDAEEEALRTRRTLYTRQLEYVNQKIIELIDRLLQGGGQEPVIILQSDEGPDPQRKEDHGAAFDWRQATPDDLAEKFGILHAVRMPGTDARIPATLSPVNTFRMLFNVYFGAGLPLLPDQSFVFGDEQLLYDFTPVDPSARTQQGIPPESAPPEQDAGVPAQDPPVEASSDPDPTPDPGSDPMPPADGGEGPEPPAEPQPGEQQAAPGP